MSADRNLPSRGFTLLEVVVALAIAGLALVGLFRAGSGGLFASDIAARAEAAVQRAQSHLAAVLSGEVALCKRGVPPHGRKMRLRALDGGGYRWTLRVRPLTARQSLAPDGVTPVNTTLFNVEVAISWPGRAGERA